MTRRGCPGIVLNTEADQAMKQEFDEALGDLARNEIPLPPWTEYIDISKEEGSREWNFDRREPAKFWLPRKPDHILGKWKRALFVLLHIHVAETLHVTGRGYSVHQS